MSTAVVDHPVDIARLRLTALVSAANMKADHGISLARNLPRIADVVEQYRLSTLIQGRPTWATVADALEALKAQCDEGAAEYVAHPEQGPSVILIWPQGESVRLLEDMHRRGKIDDETFQNAYAQMMTEGGCSHV